MKVNRCSRRKILNPCSLKMHNYQINTYIGCEHLCRYCYGLNNTETDWHKEILIHKDIIEQLAQEINSLEPQSIYIGMNSDPYQPSEKTFKKTRKVLELFVKRGFSVCILTKSELVTRDIDLIAKMHGSSVGFSIAFQDERTRQLFEKNSPSNKERIEALKILKNSGIETYTLICPIMPFITDIESVIELMSPYSDTIWVYKIHMESENDKNWINVKSILDKHFPELTEQYQKITFSKNHPYWKRIRHKLEEIKSKKCLNLKIEL